MTKETLFRALGEVREEQIADADGTFKEKNPPWRRYGTLAACLAVVLAAGFVWNQKSEWSTRIKNFTPTPYVAESASDSGGGVDTGDLDGSEYWTEGTARPAAHYSVNVEIGEIEPRRMEAMEREDAVYSTPDVSMDIAVLTPEEIFAQDTVIFRGTVQNMRYYMVEAGGVESYYTAASVEITDPIRGDLAAGETRTVLFPGGENVFTCISGPLDRLAVGSDVILMPVVADAKTGWRDGDSFFCYADLGELYLSEGLRYAFLDTGEEVIFERGVYADIADAETLEAAADYIRRMTAMEESRPAEIPVSSQPMMPAESPADTAQADPRDMVRGPAGARELPGGAAVGETG